MSGTVGPRIPPFMNTYSLDFDGVEDYIDCGTSIGDSLGDNYTGDLSVSFWFKANTVTPVNDGIFSIGDFANSVGEFTISIYNNKLYYRLNNGGWTKIVDFTDTTSWHHLLVIYKSGSEADSKMFLDGADVGTASGTFPTTSLMDFAGLKTTIGAYYSQAFGINGNIDEVAIFNNDQTANAADIYNLGVPTDLTSLSPLAWYRMGDSGVFRDPQWLLPSNENKDKVSNYSLDFDGVDDYIDLGDNDNFSFGNGTADSPFSISSWIKINDTSGFRILNKYVSPIIEYQFGIGSAGNLQLYIFDSNSQYRARLQSSILNTNQWYHVVSTYNGVGGVNAQDGIKIYVDGIRVDDTSVSVGDYVAMNNTTNPVYIGKLQTSYTDGNIDEVSVFNTELSSEEVLSIYNGGGVTTPGDLTSLNPIAWWKMGDNSTFLTNWTVPDAVGSNDGTSANMTIEDRVGTAPSSSNNALSFNMDLIDRVEDTPPT